MIGGVVVWLVCPLDRSILLTPGSSPGQALTLSHGGERGLLLSAEGAALVGVVVIWLGCPFDRPFPLTPGSSPGQALTLSHGGGKGIIAFG